MSTVTRAGDFRPVHHKQCPCGRRGEWPGRLCPNCRGDERLVAAADPAEVIAPASHDETHRLFELAQVINTEHRSVLDSGRGMIEHAIRCGEALNEARDQASSGTWLDWYARHIESLHITTAYRYMRLARHKELVLSSDVRHIEEAMRLLADKPRLGQGPRRYSREDRQAMVALYNEHGMGAVLQAFGCTKSTVWRYTSKLSPDKLNPDADARRPKQVTDEMIDRLAWWLVMRFGGDGYPSRVTTEVRADATEALTRLFTEQIKAAA